MAYPREPRIGDKVIYYPHALHDKFDGPVEGEICAIDEKHRFVVDIFIWPSGFPHTEKRVSHAHFSFDYLGEWVYIQP